MEPSRPRRQWLSRRRLLVAGGSAAVILAAGTVAVAALAGGGSPPARNIAVSHTSTTTTSVPVAPTTTTATSTTTTALFAANAPGLGMGDSGAPVTALQQRLTALKYDPGTIDGHYGTETWQAVAAFQKVTGLARTGRATPDVLSALNRASAPAPQVPAGGPNRVEIDIPHQVLMLYEGGQLVRTMMISSGGGYRYCVPNPPGPDQCDVAVTPGGSYHVFSKYLGMQTSKLGQLFNPLYFNGGIAIHGEPAVPLYPASHGCVRIPMSESIWFYNRVNIGEPVYVTGASAAPVPFNTPAPGGQTPVTHPAPVPTTSTTAPPRTTTTVPPTTTTRPPSTTSTTRPATTSTTA